MDRWLELVHREFDSADEFAAWAGENGFGRVGLQGGDGALQLIADLRPALAALADALADQRRPARELAALDGVVASVAGRMRVGLGGVAFVADAPPIVQLPLQLAFEAVDFALDTEAPRLARCQRDEPVCGRYFVDRSRDGRGRWCSTACGTVERVRKFRGKAGAESA